MIIERQDQVTDAVLEAYAARRDPRLREIMAASCAICTPSPAR